MTRDRLQLPLSDAAGGHRYPGFDSAAQAPHWDEATRDVVLARLGDPPPLSFFTPDEARTARALFIQLLDQSESDEERVPVLNLVDARLAANQTDGWYYADLPPDRKAWQETLAALDAQTREQHGCPFADATGAVQRDLLQGILTADRWRDYPAKQVWSLWTRYACTAFYSHPSAWDEIGFAGPAYPRGYKNIGVDALEPFEQRDVRPQQDPLDRSAEIEKRAEAAQKGGRG
ncbi:hypothetical protein BKD30_12675 [Tersicoccus phoenicis]|uniref:Gluconate 2-dehydrogenase n=1 Tax=Tersicoccus phoenicis TaxID=554083 RepID=A0A1R1L7F3_9MICC|nr:gluconate 2-dehydrogenase subunit 3 family protein [Tersicoccus phoenicis]OMH23468.1 hypothetical protein BKD30_12675 [Tersicoccus phoenicis]